MMRIIKGINNQKFSAIPYYLFKQKLESKLSEIGCEFVLQEESYTSKCSFVDNEEIREHEEYSGKRIKRGLFRTKNGLLVNADMNGAANIMRKNVGLEVKTDKLMGFIVSPLRLSNIFDILEIQRAESSCFA
jgi:putative transposase